MTWHFAFGATLLFVWLVATYVAWKSSTAKHVHITVILNDEEIEL